MPNRSMGRIYYLWRLYDSKVSMSTRSEGLFLLKKLSKEHLDLTSYSRMRVNLAVEVDRKYNHTCIVHRC